MFAKFLLFMICNSAMLVIDLPKWKRTTPRARILYLLLMLPIAYLGFLYITELPWPNLDELIDFFLLAPAKRIVAWFRLPT